MRSNLNFDQELLKKVMELGSFRYKTEAINVALMEYVRHHEQKEVISLFSTIDYDDDYDYKKAREKRA